MQDQNPYAPPPLSASSPSARPGVGRDPAVAAGDGPWRDQELLVFRISKPQLPARCIKTNEAMDGPLTQTAVSWIPRQKAWILWLGLIGHLIAKSASGKSISVALPLSSEWQAGNRRVGRIGWGIVIAGIVGFVIGTILSVAIPIVSMDSPGGQTMADIALGITAFCPLIALGGIVYLAFGHKPVVVAHNITRDYAWLSGVNQDYLNSLPQWPGSHLGEGADLR